MHLTNAIIFLFVAIFCIGAAIGGLIERALKKRAKPPQPEPVSMPSPVVNTLAEAEDVEVLSAWRTRNNKVWLAMDGARLNDKAALQPGQYQRLLNLVIDLRPWLEMTRPDTPAPALPQPSIRTAAPVPAVVQPQVQAGNKKTAPVEEAAAPAPVLDSIIQQIDKVLQARLVTSPFKDRDIQLVEGPGGIVLVKDGVKSYEGVDGIPDPEIKDLIRQAVAEWEKGAK
jgi:hypothetical protein